MGDLYEEAVFKALVDLTTGEPLFIGVAIIVFTPDAARLYLGDLDQAASAFMGGMEERITLAGEPAYIATAASIHFALVLAGERVVVILRGFDKDRVLEVAEDFAAQT